VLITKHTLWENLLNFVRDMPMIYAEFITVVIVFSEKRNRRN
jgi:hypothetical protein